MPAHHFDRLDRTRRLGTCRATMEAVVGDRSRFPKCHPARTDGEPPVGVAAHCRRPARRPGEDPGGSPVSHLRRTDSQLCRDVGAFGCARSRHDRLGSGSRLACRTASPQRSEFVVAALATARIGAVAVPSALFDRLRTTDTLAQCGRRNGPRRLRVPTPRLPRDSVGGRPELDLRSSARCCRPRFPTLRRLPTTAHHTPSIRAGRCSRCKMPGNASASKSSGPPRAVTPADRLVIVHTSGCTAEPKGVIHTTVLS